jgi:hypothetical protein
VTDTHDTTETVERQGEITSPLTVMAALPALFSVLYLVDVGTHPIFVEIAGIFGLVLGVIAAILGAVRRRRLNFLIGAVAAVLAFGALSVTGFTLL